MAVVEEEEISVIQGFLPQQLGEEEFDEIVTEIVSQTDAEGMKDMGKVMGIASQKLAGQADGKTLASIVKKLLA